MPWQDALLIASFIISLFDLCILTAIFLDDHAMRLIAEESRDISRKSLQAQEQYLDLRRRWYESRGKKKADDHKAVQPSA